MMILALHAGLSGSYSLSKKKGQEQKIGKNTFKLNFDAWRINIAPTKNEVCVNGSRKNEHDKNHEINHFVNGKTSIFATINNTFSMYEIFIFYLVRLLL